MKVLVTGGAGFIGSHLVDYLLREEAEVWVFDNLSTGKRENFEQNVRNIKFHFTKGDINSNLQEYFKKNEFEVVFHLAAIPRVEYSIQEPIKTNKVMIDGTLNILQLSRNNGVKRFVFASSSAVYGDVKSLPTIESDMTVPLSPYGLQKLVGEHYARLYTLLYGLETICFRLFNVYGPRQSLSGNYANLIPKFIDAVVHNNPPPIRGNGKNTRDYVYVGDVVEAFIKASRIKLQQKQTEIINIGGGKAYSIIDVYKSILTVTKKTVEPQFVGSVIEPKDTLSNIDKAEAVLDWKPKTEFIKGLENSIEYFKNLG
jgi:UDP-N-acetylglucosamine 4-epimerase